MCIFCFPAWSAVGWCRGSSSSSCRSSSSTTSAGDYEAVEVQKWPLSAVSLSGVHGWHCVGRGFRTGCAVLCCALPCTALWMWIRSCGGGLERSRGKAKLTELKFLTQLLNWCFVQTKSFLISQWNIYRIQLVEFELSDRFFSPSSAAGLNWLNWVCSEKNVFSDTVGVICTKLFYCYCC